MTISERINLHRCGYSRTEIDALAAAEKEEQQAAENVQEEAAAETPEENVNNDPAQAQDRSADILAAINNLTLAIQAKNVNSQQQPAQQQVTMNDIMNSI